MTRGYVILLAAAAALACGGQSESDGAADSPRVPPAANAAPVAWRFSPPPSWSERTRSVIVDDAERATRYPGARAVERFEYVPLDSAAEGETLLLISVYDSATWSAMRGAAAGATPPAGDVIAQTGGNVYVAVIPRANPFAPASADARAFDARTLTLDAVKQGFQVVSSS